MNEPPRILLREQERRLLLKFHLKDIKSQGHKDAEIILGSNNWPVVTFTSKGERYYYDRGMDAFTKVLLDCCPKREDDIYVTALPAVERVPKDNRPLSRFPRVKAAHDPLSPPGRETLNKYGITGEQYMSLLNNQEGRCWICRRPPKVRRLNIDHDHKKFGIKSVRGLLCYSCNYGLGVFRDRIESFERAVLYLKTPNPFG